MQQIWIFKADKLLLNRWAIRSNVISNVILLNDKLFLKNNIMHTLCYTWALNRRGSNGVNVNNLDRGQAGEPCQLGCEIHIDWITQVTYLYLLKWMTKICKKICTSHIATDIFILFQSENLLGDEIFRNLTVMVFIGMSRGGRGIRVSGLLLVNGLRLPVFWFKRMSGK